MAFSIQLDTYRGPLDLLLYLVRQEELEITCISISRITEQYLHHLSVLEELDINDVGDFLAVAAQLIEMKSRMVLPVEDEIDRPVEDPRNNLVERLLAYKAYRDGASMLQEQGRTWSRHFARQANDLPARTTNPDDRPIQDVELWDLVAAFSRVVREHEAVRPGRVVYDDTPIATYIQRVQTRLADVGPIRFRDLFGDQPQRGELIGTFLAILELIRYGHATAKQESLFGELWIHAGDSADRIELDGIDEYDHGN